MAFLLAWNFFIGYEMKKFKMPNFFSKSTLSMNRCMTHIIIHMFEKSHTLVKKRFSLNVWIGIMGNNVLGPVELPSRLNADHYLQFLQTTLPNLLDEIP